MKSVLITGGGTGIGAAAARLLTADGWQVADAEMTAFGGSLRLPVDGGSTTVDVGTVPFDFLIKKRGSP